MLTGKVPVYCYQCVAGPDLLKVVVRDGVAPVLTAAVAGALMVAGQAWMKAVLIRQAGQLRPITLPAERLLGRPS